MSAVRPTLKAALVLACLAALSAYYFYAFPLPHFLGRLTDLLLTAFILIAAAGYGHRSLSYLRIRSSLSTGEYLLFSALAGLGLLGTLMMLLGWLHLWTPACALGLLALGCLALGPSGLTEFHAIASAWNERTLEQGLWVPALLLYSGGILSFVLAFTPVTYYDSLVYHFAMPSIYVHAHQWMGIRELIYSSFPQQLEMLWTLGLLVGNDTVANLLAWSLALLLLLLVISFGKRFFSLRAGVRAAALLAVMPSFLLLSSGGYIDVGLTLFVFASLYAGLIVGEKSNRGLILLSGIFAGWAVGSKYTGAIPLVLTGALILWKSKHRFRDGWLYGASSMAVCAPWLLKNWIFVGNPVFPFLYNWSSGPQNPWLPQAASGYFRGLTEYQPRSLGQIVRVLIEIPLKPLGFGGGADVMGDFGWAPLLWFLPALWIPPRRARVVHPLLLYAIAYLIPWGMTRPVLRFLLPLAPVLALLAAEGWTSGLQRQGPFIRWAARGFMGCFILSDLFIFFSIASVFSPFAVAVGLETRDAYLTRKLDYYGAASYINSQTDPQATVFIVGDQRGYYYDRRHRVTPVFSQNPLVNWADAAASPVELRELLKKEGFTHLVINRQEMQRLQGYHMLAFSPQGQRNWDLLQSQVLPKPLYHDSACDVYAL